MNTKRKNRAPMPRAPRARTVPAEGVYKNAHFMHAIACHVGDTVQVHTQSDSIWEGVFRTFSAQFEVVLEVAHKVDKEGVVAVESVVEKMIFKPEDVISIKAKDSDLEYATRDTFQTDAAISKFNGRNIQFGEERCLQPWDGSEGISNGDGIGDSLEQLDQLEQHANGWDANDMFRKNEQDYGVQSTFDQSLSGYTMQFQKKDTPEFRDAEAKAQEIAAEIESQPLYKRRMELENGDEEDRYAAVQRPPTSRHTRPSPPPSASAMAQSPAPANGGSSVQAGDKYVHPNRRKNPQAGKLIKSSPQVPQQQSPGVQSKGPPTPTSSLPGSQYPTLPHHPAHQQPHQQQVHVIGMTVPPQTKTYAAAGAGVSSSAQPPSHNYHTPPPFIPHVHGGPPVTNNKVNGTDGVPKKMVPPPLQQRQPRHLAHQAHQTPVPFPAVPPQAIQSQVLHSDSAPVQILPHQMGEQTHAGQPILGGPVGGPPVPMQAPDQRHQRRPEVQELRKFGSDFKLPPEGAIGASAGADSVHNVKPLGVHQDGREASHKGPPLSDPSKGQGSPDQHPPKHPQDMNNKHTPEASATSIQPTTATAQIDSSSSDKVSTGLKKFTLNPNAKEFNPSAKPFIPRSPSTPNPSRPHTPGTPVGTGGPMGPPQYVGGVGHHGVHHAAAHQHHLAGNAAVMVGAPGTPGYATVVHPHHASPSPAFHQPPQPHHPHHTRFRKVPMGSQMQVANATGQPLLTPAPLPQFVPYAHSTHPHQPPPQYPHMVRVFHQHEGAASGGPVQYLAAQPAPPSTPSPGQGYHPPPSPAVGPGPPPPPPQQYQTQPFHMLCPIIPQPSQHLYLQPSQHPQQPPQAQQQQQHHNHIPMMIPPPQQGGGQAGQHP
ncbi:ataxin-2-like protein isoform X2 [Arctopsyche grandis]|uniref:ataxin-2-like protein isoform X2 n=1 Tax=Arctopsyche grandis TaxID=121162 RepID=UPI00406D63B6